MMPSSYFILFYNWLILNKLSSYLSTESIEIYLAFKLAITDLYISICL